MSNRGMREREVERTGQKGGKGEKGRRTEGSAQRRAPPHRAQVDVRYIKYVSNCPLLSSSSTTNPSLISALSPLNKSL